MEENFDKIINEMIGNYIKEHLKIEIGIVGMNNHIIEVKLYLNNEQIDSDSVFVDRWMVGYGERI